MKCPDSGTIQAYIDGELDIKNKKEVENHIINCNDCTHLYKSLKSNDDFVFEKMTSYKNYNEAQFFKTGKGFSPPDRNPCQDRKKKGRIILHAQV
jgi:anti-sigma factor RsiW